MLRTMSVLMSAALAGAAPVVSPLVAQTVKSRKNLI
jgi:hypothetical protein